MTKKVFVNQDHTFMSLKGLAWSLQVKRVPVAKGEMVLVKPVKVTAIPNAEDETLRFEYEDLQKPIWLSIEEATFWWRKIGEILATSEIEKVEAESA